MNIDWRDMQTMEAGREMDALIAERIFGLVPCQNELHRTHDLPWCYAEASSPDSGGELRQYSTDIAEAWKVFDHLGGHVTIHTINGGWACRINDWMRTHCWAETPALAICRSALAAVSCKEEATNGE